MAGIKKEEEPKQSVISIFRPQKPFFSLDTPSTRSAAGPEGLTTPRESQSSSFQASTISSSSQNPRLRSSTTTRPESSYKIENVPIGLKILALEEYFFLKESINFTEYYHNTANTYELFDLRGNRMYIALEIKPEHTQSSSNTCSITGRNWFSFILGYKFTIPIINNIGREIMRFVGQTAPKFQIFNATTAKVVIQTETEVLGYIAQDPDEPNHVKWYSVQNVAKDEIYFIKSSPGAGSIGTDMLEAEFSIFDSKDNDEEERIGKISLLWSDLLANVFPSAKNFGIHFPLNATPKMKAVLLGAMFLINYQFYDRKKFVVGTKIWELVDDEIP